MSLRLEKVDAIPPLERRRSAELLASVREIRNLAATDLAAKFGTGHWANQSTQERLKRERKRKEILIIRAGEERVATMALSTRGPGFLRKEWFVDPDATALYLTGLAVSPAWQGKGIGRWCLQQACKLARQRRIESIRFDAYDAPAGAAPFYVSCGCVERRRFSFNGVPLIAFERMTTT